RRTVYPTSSQLLQSRHSGEVAKSRLDVRQSEGYAVIRYKKGRPSRCNRGEREESTSGGFAPRPPRFNALVPVRKLGKEKTGPFADPASVPAPRSALGLLLSRALSSAQAEAIVPKAEETRNPRSECARRPSSGRLSRKT